VRIVSLIPSATEILFALGLDAEICGVSHECDFPPEARSKRKVVYPRIPPGLPAGEVDRRVRDFVARGESLYSVDAKALVELDPDLIITQDLCHVCAATPDDLASTLAAMPRAPRVLTLDPQSLADVYNDIRTIGEVTGRSAQAAQVVASLEARIAAVERAVAKRARPRVLCLEWLDPPFPGGHWVPEMVERAGGKDVLGRAGVPSVAVNWNEVLVTKPDVIVLMPCGYNAEQSAADYAAAPLPPGWQELSVVKNGRVYFVDGSSYFSRSGPRLVDGVEILARILHPECATALLPARAIYQSSDFPIAAAHS
jgi:iron complex transport system substrate-binding protein